jgi:hypothetical protein
MKFTPDFAVPEPDEKTPLQEFIDHEHLDVLGYDYEIAALKKDDRPDLDGQCTSGKKRKLEYDPELTGLAADDVVMHEIVHAVDNILNLGLREAGVHRLGYAIGKVLRDNPHLVEYYQQSSAEDAES